MRAATQRNSETVPEWMHPDPLLTRYTRSLRRNPRGGIVAPRPGGYGEPMSNYGEPFGICKPMKGRYYDPFKQSRVLMPPRNFHYFGWRYARSSAKDHLWRLASFLGECGIGV